MRQRHDRTRDGRIRIAATVTRGAVLCSAIVSTGRPGRALPGVTLACVKGAGLRGWALPWRKGKPQRQWWRGVKPRTPFVSMAAAPASPSLVALRSARTVATPFRRLFTHFWRLLRHGTSPQTQCSAWTRQKNRQKNSQGRLPKRTVPKPPPPLARGPARAGIPRPRASTSAPARSSPRWPRAAPRAPCAPIRLRSGQALRLLYFRRAGPARLAAGVRGENGGAGKHGQLLDHHLLGARRRGHRSVLIPFR